MKQDELMGDIDSIVLRSEGTTVRQILKIPEELFESKLHFAKVDVQRCFDSIDQEQVLEIIKEE
ncbi:10286_t:CDS:2, partial [Gigaspora margarita]